MPNGETIQVRVNLYFKDKDLALSNLSGAAKLKEPCFLAIGIGRPGLRKPPLLPMPGYSDTVDIAMTIVSQAQVCRFSPT